MSEKEVRTRGLRFQVLAFTAVGGAGFAVDVWIFNVLLSLPVSAHGWPLVAKATSTAVAILVNWVGNRLWTFRDRRRTDTVREATEFVIASLAGSIASLACLGVSHYVLGFTSVWADNVSANVIGLALGSAVRFAAYRWWVFGAERSTTGRSTTTVAPSPGRLSTRAEPPAREASLATIASPSPPPE